MLVCEWKHYNLIVYISHLLYLLLLCYTVMDFIFSFLVRNNVKHHIK